MELKDTVYEMTSSNKFDRFRAEYYQLKIRQRKLEHIIASAELGKVNLSSTSLDLLKEQYNYMGLYASTLKQRAIIENIDLEAVKLD